YAIGGVIAASVATGVLPHVDQQASLLTVLAIFGAVSGTAGVAIGAALAESSTPATRGLVMGGYSTALYLGLAIGSFALGPVITHRGYAAGFAAGGIAGAGGTLVAALLWWRSPISSSRSALTASEPVN